MAISARVSVISVILVLVGLLLILAILRARLGWPSEKSENVVLIGVLLLSLFPVLLALLDVIIERGGVIKYGGVEIDFSEVRQKGMSGMPIPVNIGSRGQAVNESSVTQILDMLKQATSSDVVIIDLEEGHAWWETRLFVLLAGAERLKKPGKIVFVGTDGGREQCFQGWAHANDLFQRVMRAHPQYPRSFYAARAAASQWRMVEPVNSADPSKRKAPPPNQPTWMNVGLATRYSAMAFDENGLPNELAEEQFLATDLGDKVESQEQKPTISLVRLDELFRPVLNKDAIDQSWSFDRQISTFFGSDAPYIAVTQNGKYSTLVSRLAVLSEILKTMVENKRVR